MMARMRRLLFALIAAVFVAALVSSALLDGAARTIAFVAVIVAGVVAYAAADQRHLQQK